MINLGVTIAGVPWKNPISTASGTFQVRESSAFYPPEELGALITKGIALEAWKGNPTPRIAETYGGMLNAIGLENPGIEAFLREDLPVLSQYDTPIVVNIIGKTVEEYGLVAERLSEEAVDLLEVNISCPNIKEGGIGFGTRPEFAFQVARRVRESTKKPFLVKLSPNVTDIGEIAKAVEAAGADGISLMNTLLGMQIDVRRKKPTLANVFGGLSGPAIKPVAVRMVYQVRKAIPLPIVGMGGIRTGEDVAEFLLAGANAVSVGTAALVEPSAPLRILKEFEAYMEQQGFGTVRELKEAFQDIER